MRRLTKYWNNFLIWVNPRRRQDILSEMARKNQELGLYDEADRKRNKPDDKK
jgi:hypothetical protein